MKQLSKPKTSRTHITVRGIELLDDMDDSHLGQQLTHICHACGERRRSFEDNEGISNLQSALFFGKIQEQTADFIDILTLTH